MLRALRPPHYRTSFIGRRRELATLKETLSAGETVALLGPGGVGKTRLASEAVSGLRACFIDLTPARVPGEAAAVVLQAIGSREKPAPDHDALAHAASALAQVPADVVVLDNLEQLQQAGGFVQRLRTEGPARSWLLTSRSPLGMGERQIPVAPFEVTGEAREAVDLFLRVLSPSAPAGLHAQRTRLARLAGALDGLPLALELAAARAAVLSLDEIERRLHDPLELLVDPARPEDKGSTLWRSVSWSVELLSVEARRVLARCSVFAGWFEAEGARAVAGAGVEGHLGELSRMHLLREEGGRYRPYEVVARFAERLLERSGEQAEAVLEHARWCQAHQVPTGADEMWNRYERVGADVDLAQCRAEEPDAEPAVREIGQDLALRWHVIQLVRKTPLEFIARTERLAPRLDSQTAGFLLQRRASMLFELDRPLEGEALLEPVVAFARQQGLDELLVISLCSLANGALQRDQLQRVESLLQEAMAVARAAGLHELERRFLFGPLNVPLLHQGRFAEVAERLRRVRELSADHTWFLQALDTREAQLMLELGDWEEVERRLQRLDPSRVSPVVEVERRFVLSKLALIRHPRPAALVAAQGQDLPVTVEREQFETLLLVARGIEGEPLDGAFASLGEGRGETLSRLVLEIAAVGAGRVPPALVDRRDPVMSAISDALALLREHMQGVLTADEALRRLDELRPRCWELHLARRVLSDREARLHVAVVGPDGAFFEQVGARIPLPAGLLRRDPSAKVGGPAAENG
jgi:predicted ATPase